MKAFVGFLLVLGPHPGVLMGYSGICAQQSLLEGLGLLFYLLASAYVSTPHPPKRLQESLNSLGIFLLPVPTGNTALCLSSAG